MDTHPIERDRLDRESGGTANFAGPSDRNRPDPSDPSQRDASSVAGEIKDQAAELTRRARDAASDVGRQASDATRQAFSQFRDQGQQVFTDQKQRAADSIHQFSESLQHAADNLRRDSDDRIAVYVDAIADTARKAEQYVRGCDLNSLFSDTRSFARKQPTWFLGAAFLAGLAVARFAKASDPGRSMPSRENDFQPPSPGFDRALGDYQQDDYRQGPTGTAYPSYDQTLDRAGPAVVPVGGSLDTPLDMAPDTASTSDANALIESTAPRTTDPDFPPQFGTTGNAGARDVGPTSSGTTRGDSDFPMETGTLGQNAASGLPGSKNASETVGDPDLEPQTRMAEIKPPETECGTEVRNG